MSIWKQITSYFTFKMFLDYVYITIGLLMYAFGWAVFLLPYKLVTGGVTGIASLVFYGTGIPVSYTYFAINVGLLIAGLKILGLRFMAKTVYAILTLTVMLDIFQNMVTLPDGSLYQLLGPNEVFMSIILGSVFCGGALAIVFLNNGSTGGTDIIAAIVNKYRDISLGRVLLVADLIIISFSYVIFSDWRKIVFGLVLMALENFILDYIMDNRRESVQFLIFSRKYKEIAHEIGTKLGRGITILNGHGWYSGEEVMVLCILAKKREAVTMLRMIKRIDSNAFVSVGAVNGVYGEGFDPIKVKAQKHDQEKLEFKSDVPKYF